MKKKIFLSALSLASALGWPSPAPAQSTPFVGLSSLHATLTGELAEQGFGPAEGDHFGAALAAGDFNGDGADDLAAGIPGDDCTSSTLDCGAVMLRWGFPGYGLTASVLFLSQFAPGSPDPPEQRDYLGAALAAGDFNGDGRDDLAIGQPKLVYANPGGVEIHYGLPGGIQPAAEHFLKPGSGGVPAPGGDFPNKFGNALAVGDWNGDGFDDLAIGFVEDTQTFGGGLVGAGSVVVAHGGSGGVSPFDGYRISQSESGIPDDPENGDRFGATLAAGDFNSDGFDDLVIGVPEEDGVGAILVLFGSPNSLIFANNYWLGEIDLGTVAPLGDRFGAALTTGDWNGDGFDDLAIGVPGRDNVNADPDIGMIGVLYGAPGGFNFSVRQWWWEDILGGVSAANDRFGEELISGDWNGDGYDDLAVGTPGNDPSNEGSVTVLNGSANLLTEHARRFSLRRDGLPGPPAGQNGFALGEVLAAGDFDGNGFADLAAGIPGLDSTFVNDGGALVLYGALFADGFESGGSFNWSPSEN